MKLSLLFIVLMLTMMGAWADSQTLVTINDPAGDDNGAGTLIYPQRSDYQPGDLDLLKLQISRDEDGFWFSAMFKNNIRDPKDVPNSIGPESLSNFARKGFYQFNVDIYIDTDCVNGSGNTFTLPGRKVRIDPRFAWERAVILTPRPELMRQQLLGALEELFPKRTRGEIEASIDQSIIFPTRIRVHGKSIDFFVPASFFAGSDGKAWGATAFVTGALTTISADFSLINSSKRTLDQLQLGVMQPVPGHSKDTFGYSGGDMPSPVVDLLAISVEQQKKQLGEKIELTGVAWGSYAIEGATPAAATAATAASAVTAVPVGQFFQPESPATVMPPASVPAPAGQLADPSIFKRLQTLQQLLEQKLINEDEYKQQKQRILQEI